MLTTLANLDLTLVCYDLTSTYFEGGVGPSKRFQSKAFGYSRDKRGDRPQVVIGLLCTGDGLPIAHRVWPGDTGDVTTLPTVLDDLRDRFAVGRICLVADRGLISSTNLDAVTEAGFAHIIATRLHRDPVCAAALEQAHLPTAVWRTVDWRRWVCDVTLADGRRAVVVHSATRHRRDVIRTGELVARCETKLLGLEHRVDRGDLIDAGKIGRAAQRILGPSGVGRLFDVKIGTGRFRYHYNEAAMAYEDVLAGHYVLVPDLTHQEASAPRVAAMWHQLRSIEARFRTMKDFLALRPVYHWTESRVRGHVALACSPPSSKPSSPAPCATPASPTPTSTASTSPPPERCGSCNASAASPSPPAPRPSPSPPAPHPTNARSSPASASTPPPGPPPRSPEPPEPRRVVQTQPGAPPLPGLTRRTPRSRVREAGPSDAGLRPSIEATIE
jgi:hypothetical protein